MTRVNTLATVALAVSLLPTGAALAQQPSAETRAELSSPVSPPSLENLDIDFPGGTLEEYLRHLQDRAGVNNVVIRNEEIGEIKMPEVKLAGVHFADAIQLVSSLIDQPSDPTDRAKTRHIDISPVGANRSIYILYFREPHRQPTNTYRSAVSVDFPGGSLAEFVQYLQEKSGARGILLRGPADRFEIKPIEFESVQVLSILSAFSGAEQVLDSGERLRLNVEIREGLLLVEVQSDARQMNQQNPRRTASWSLASMRGQGRLTADQMLTAIEAAIEVGGGEESTSIRFHEETSLLIVSTHLITIQTIEAVLGQLQKSADEAARQHERIEMKQSEYRTMQANEVRLIRTIERINESIDAAAATEDPNRRGSLPLLEQELRKAEGHLDQIREEMVIVREQIEQLQAS